jgi:hypothetical protein
MWTVMFMWRGRSEYESVPCLDWYDARGLARAVWGHPDLADLPHITRRSS